MAANIMYSLYLIAIAKANSLLLPTMNKRHRSSLLATNHLKTPPYNPGDQIFNKSKKLIGTAGNMPKLVEGVWGAGPAGLSSQECPRGHRPSPASLEETVITEFR